TIVRQFLTPMTIDYLAMLSGTFQRENEGIRLLCRGVNALFGQVTPLKLRNEVNRAIGVALMYYKENISQTTITVTEQQLQDIALRVAVHHIYYCNMQRNHYSKPNTRCKITARDVHDIDLIMAYCENEFGKDYSRYTAALLGISMDDFLCREAERRFYYNK
ncbi:MAG: hypothetical protein M3Y54_17245, partial [Bacteroidota bacterium]|nr:hypothetical protein [Bacteroidota bacterium]